MTTRRTVLLAFAGAAAGAVVAGCKGGGGTASPSTTISGSEPAPPTGPSSTAASPPPAAVMPLTGQPISDPAVAARQSLAVKIDNAPEARPQSGLDKADLVYEEVVEGGVVRFMAVFHSQEAPLVGPIRSVRLVDASLVTVLKGIFAYSGGAGAFIEAAKATPAFILSADEVGDRNGKPFSRRPGRSAPHNLYSSTALLRAAAKPSNDAPPVLYTYRQAGTSLGGGAAVARTATVVMGDRTTALWTYADDTQSWARTTNGTPHVIEGGGQLRFPNVVLQFVPYKGTEVRDVSGAVSPVAVVEGEGDVWVLSGPALVKGRWKKAGKGDITSIVDASGAPIGLQPGPTWHMLVPTGTNPSIA